VWRPEVLPVPKITGTLPAKVSAAAAEESFYATIDEIGRYRVKLPFDLDTWNPGGDSRPVRLAKAYAGSHYGIHFPLHSSVEVALGFTNGDPNRPYIAHVFHDSNHEDHVNNQWSTRNVIRTWGKNKLRMEDYKGKEHVKLATEYNKTQLNLGHLVDAKREQRGEGFELRTDGWGVVRSAKGLFLSADLQSGAIGQTRDMAAAKSQIDAANLLTKNLSKSPIFSRNLGQYFTENNFMVVVFHLRKSLLYNKKSYFCIRDFHSLTLKLDCYSTKKLFSFNYMPIFRIRSPLLTKSPLIYSS
jgi:type VI secretion system secreted protein VgrG